MLRGETVKNGDFSDSEEDAVDAVILYFQLTSNFPSWTSRVRSPSPALNFQELPAFQIRVQPNAAHSLLVDQSRLERIYRIDSAFKRSLCIHVNVHVKRMSLLIGDELWIDLEFPHQRR